MALEVLARAEVESSAAALVPWTERSRAAAERFDFVRCAEELNADVLFVCGEDDDSAFSAPAAMLWKPSSPRGSKVICEAAARFPEWRKAGDGRVHPLWITADDMEIAEIDHSIHDEGV